MLDPKEKAKFILALHKHSLQAFDSGGPVVNNPGTSYANLNGVDPSQGFAGSIGNILGINDNFQAGAANLQNGTSAEQINKAYQGAVNGLQGQQNFANAAAVQGGFQNQQNVLGQQQQLANELAAQSRGAGPNPAQSALNQATGQNVENQAALMASQRGASANPALIAREAARQGASIQQQAVGQGATLQAQQQIAAQQQLAAQQAQMQGVAANQIAAQGQGATQYSNALQNEQNILQGANTSANNAAVSQQGNINNVNAQTAAANQNQNSNVIGAIGSVASKLPVLGALFGATGGDVKKSSIGSNISIPMNYPAANFSEGGPVSFAGQWLNSSVQPTSGPTIASPSTPSQMTNPFSFLKKDKSSGPGLTGGSSDAGTAPTGAGGSYGLGGADMVNELGGSGGSPASSELQMPELGSGFGSAASQAPTLMEAAPLLAKGGKVDPRMSAKGGNVKAMGKGEKAVKKDNSYANDKVPAMLSEGEIVLPRSVTMHPNAPQKAAEFVAQTLAKRRVAKR